MSPSPGATAACEERRPRLRFELADVVHDYGSEYLETHTSSRDQRAVLRAIGRCRTHALGGHVEECDQCGERRIAYNSCRNRHCPKCQGSKQGQWVDAQQASLLPVPYFHMVFTLPHELNALMRVNPAALYGLLFRSAADTLLRFGRDPKRLGAEIGVTAVLHTWGQNLTEHVHLHCIVTGGGLEEGENRWKQVRNHYLFPVKALGRLFRGRYRAGLEQLRAGQKLVFAGQSASLAEDSAWKTWIAGLGKTEWVIYAKPPFGGPERVLKYLGRYTHRIAISNRRILHVGDGVVRFLWKDYRNGSKHQVMELEAGEFLRRFLLHVVPKGFMRIRHFGLLANRHRRRKLRRCRELLGERTSPTVNDATPFSAAGQHDTSTRTAPAVTCSACGTGTLRTIETFPPQRGPPQ